MTTGPCLFFYLTGERTFYMDHIQPLTSDLKPVFFPTQLQSCKHEGAERLVLDVYMFTADFETDKIM